MTEEIGPILKRVLRRHIRALKLWGVTYSPTGRRDLKDAEAALKELERISMILRACGSRAAGVKSKGRGL